MAEYLSLPSAVFTCVTVIGSAKRIVPACARPSAVKIRVIFSFLARMNFILYETRATAIAGRDLLEVRLIGLPIGGHSDSTTLHEHSKTRNRPLFYLGVFYSVRSF